MSEAGDVICLLGVTVVSSDLRKSAKMRMKGL